MNCHALTECGDFLGERIARVVTKPLGPTGECCLRGRKQPFDLFCRKFLSERQGRQAGFKQDLVGISIADSTEQVRIAQSPLQRVVGRGERRGEVLEIRIKHLQPSGVECAQP